MTVQPATRPLIASPLIAVVLLGGLAIGFVAGQAAPDLIGIGSRAGPAAQATGRELSPEDDYGIRHLAAARVQAVTQLTDGDDWALRHRGPAPLGPADDYGTRH
jgi:hypothetical protein